MGDPAAYRRQVHALILGDREMVRQLNQRLALEDRAGLDRYLAAVFEVLVQERLAGAATADGVSADAVAALADAAAAHYRGRGKAANELVIEDAILAAVGSPRILGEVPADRSEHARVMVVGTLSETEPWVRSRITELLDRAETAFDGRPG